MKDAIIAGDEIIITSEITGLDLSRLAAQEVVVHTPRGDFVATGFHAIEAIMAVKPSAFEGRREVRWRKGAWALHNLIGHPVMQFLAWAGYPRAGVRFHDRTSPKPLGYR